MLSLVCYLWNCLRIAWCYPICFLHIGFFFLSMMLTHVILGFWWKAHPLGLSIVQVVEFLRDQWRGLIYTCKHHMRNHSNMKNISKSNDLNFRYVSQNINSLQAYVIDFCRFYLIGPSYKRFTCWQVTLWNKEWHG